MPLIAFVALIAALIAAVNWWYWLDCQSMKPDDDEARAQPDVAGEVSADLPRSK
jgi:hypothetical protein